MEEALSLFRNSFTAPQVEVALEMELNEESMRNIWHSRKFRRF
jgi:hypothetical protein